MAKGVCTAKWGVWQRGACVVEEGHVWQGACVAGGCVVGMHGGGGACMAGAGGEHSRRHGHCSRQYASYWNALL